MTPEEIAAAEAEAIRLLAVAEELEGTDEEKAVALAAATSKTAEVEKAKEDARKKAEADKAKLTDPQAEALKEIMKWKKKAREAEEKAALFEGIDPTKAKTALEAQAVAERKELEARGEYDRILAQVNEQHTATLTAVESERDALKVQLEEMTTSGKKKDVANKFSNSPFVRELTISPAKVQVLYGDHFEYVGDDLVAYDKPKGETERTPLVDGQGKNLPFDAAIEKIVKADGEYEKMAKSNLRRGPGSNPTGLNPELVDKPTDSKSKIAAGLAGLKKNGLKLRE